MLENITPVLLARIQFAFTVSFHILFPAFTIGLASFLCVIAGLRLKTKKNVYEDIYNFWVKIFALSFGMGVVSGLVLSYEIGTNWSQFSHKVGNVIGPLLGYEVLTAFFLEASFLGIMLFGRKKVSPQVHFIATLMVAMGTLVSAFWILVVNSWMQTPAGHSIGSDGIFMPESWLQVIFNPSFVYRFFHMIIAAYLATAFAVGGVSAWYLLKQKHIDHAKIMFVMSMGMALLVTPVQIFIGDLHGLNTLEHQPAKVAAMEGLWETESGAPFNIFAVPNQEEQKNSYAVKIPYLSSLILTHSSSGEVKGLKSWPKEEIPPVAVVFYSFRIMILIGLLMLYTGVTALFLYRKNRLFTTKWFLKLCIFLTPSGFIALLAGWFVTEVGRQPYIVYGLLRTSEVASPIQMHQVMISLACFIFVYCFVFSMGLYYMLQLIKKGPDNKDLTDMETYGQHGVKDPVTAAEILHLDKK